jgi:hypothetical protein
MLAGTSVWLPGSLNASMGVPAAIRPSRGRLTELAAAVTPRPMAASGRVDRFQNFNGACPIGQPADIAAFLKSGYKPVNARTLMQGPTHRAFRQMMAVRHAFQHALSGSPEALSVF